MRVKLCFFFLCICLLLGCKRSEHHYQGYVESDPIYLAQPFAGFLKHRFVFRGQKVKKDQILFEIDPYPQTYELNQAKAALAQGEELLSDLQKPRRIPELDVIKAQLKEVEAEITLARLRLRRNEILFNKKVIAPDTLDASRAQIDEHLAVKSQFEANLALANLGARENQIAAQVQANKMLKAKVEEAQWSVDQKQIVAPVDGVIFDVFYREGEFVNATAPVASLLSPEDIYIEFFVPQSDLHDLKIGKRVSYQYLKSSKKFDAWIAYVSPKAEYIPPLVYSNDNFDKIVFRIKAKILENNDAFPGEPVTVNVESNHA